MTNTQCTACHATYEPGGLCPNCRELLAELLAGLAEDIDDLDVTLTRQTRTGAMTLARSFDHPLPYDPAAAEVRDLVRNLLSTWTRIECEAWGDWPDDDEASMVARLARGHWITHPAANELLADVARMHDRIVRVIDTRPARHYLGPCTAKDENDRACDGDVYHVVGHLPSCRECHADYDLEERVAWLRSVASDMLVTASVAASAFSAWGSAVTRARIYDWAYRKRITAHGHDQSGRPLYRFGDIALIVEHSRRSRAS